MLSAIERLGRASLQSPGSSKQIGFSSLEALIGFLYSQADIEPFEENPTKD
jgi:hypothetical protein